MAFIPGNSNPNLLVGGIFADLILGLGGNDTLVGDLGADTLDGGSGEDMANYASSFAAVTVNLAGGASGGTAQGDVLQSIENVTGSLFNDSLTGNGSDNDLKGLAGNDTLIGGLGNDVLDGGTGNDSMSGGRGNDGFLVDSTGDRVSGGADIDTVKSGASINLTSAQFLDALENATLTGAADRNLTGNDLDNTLRGNAGDNRINGGLGADLMIGEAGDDVYVVNSGGDVVDEGAAGSGGTDTVRSSVTFSLRGAQVAGTQTAVENLTLNGNAAVNGIGNSVDNVLTGNNAANVLTGFAGDDTLTGGGGGDTFVFRAALNANTNVDTITDFNGFQDTFQLENLYMAALGIGTLDVDAFHIGNAAADAQDRIIYQANSGHLLYDADGVGGAAATRFASVGAGLAISHLDFLVS